MTITVDISPLPTPPSRSDSPSDFSNKADAFLGSLPTLQTELNTFADQANTTKSDIDTLLTNTSDNIETLEAVVANETNINAVGGDLLSDNYITTVAININDVTTTVDNLSDIQTISTDLNSVDSDIKAISTNSGAIDIVSSDLAGSSFNYDLGSITQATEGEQAAPDGYILTIYGIRDEIVAVAAVDTAVATVSGISSEVQTASSISGDIQTLADIEDGTTATNSISTAASISSEITAVANDATDIGTVSSNISDVTTVASGIGTGQEITVVHNDLTGADNIGTVATNISDVTIVAGNTADIQTVASDLNESVSEIETVASNIGPIDTVGANIGNVNIVAGISTDVTNVSNNLDDVRNFADVYLGPSSTEPTTRNDGSSLQKGDLYFDTASNAMQVWSGTAWVTAGPVDTSNIDINGGTVDGTAIGLSNPSSVACTSLEADNIDCGTIA